jgi:soluble lytic murein transglycosylase
LRQGRYREAIPVFDDLARSAAEDTTRSAALLGLGIARFEEGDVDGGLSALRDAYNRAPEATGEKLRAAYLLGVRLNEAGEFGEAVRILEPHAQAPDILRSYVESEFARALFGDGKGEEAARHWDALLASADVPNSLKHEVYGQRVAAARSSGDGTGLEHWLSLLAGGGDAGARFELATRARDGGDLTAFGDQLRAVVAEVPSSIYALRAADALREAGLSVNAGEAGLTYYRHREYAEARDVLAAGLQEPGITPAQQTFRAFYLAASYEDDGQLEEAVVWYDQAAAFDPSSPYAHRSRYWAARATEALGDSAGASARYLALVTGGPAGEFTAESAFRAGYTLLRDGNPGAAVAAWDQLGVANSPRGLYWKGRAYRVIGDLTSADASFSAAIAGDALDFFSLQAARELGRAADVDVSYKPLPQVPATDWDAMAASLFPGRTVTPWEPRTAAAELIAVGLHDRAASVILEAAQGADSYVVYELMREAKVAGMPDVAARLAVRLRTGLGLTWEDAPKDLLRLAYPVDYVELLDGHAREYGIDPLFLAALVRQESFWDASAGSVAGALGLTQVIPPTGEAIAQSLGVDFETDDLFRPAVSLLFGANYISGQLRSLGSPYRALAAYNAGPGHAVRWADAAGGGGPADFAEAVDFSETQGYVIAVMEHYAHYQLAYR